MGQGRLGAMWNRFAVRMVFMHCVRVCYERGLSQLHARSVRPNVAADLSESFRSMPQIDVF